MVGQQLGNYLLREVIGQGGMGVVYAAVHEQLGRRAAVKVLKAVYATDAEPLGMAVSVNESLGSEQLD